jgi:hypothetical protein
MSCAISHNVTTVTTTPSSLISGCQDFASALETDNVW